MSRFNCVDWNRACAERRACSFYTTFTCCETELLALHICPLDGRTQVSFVKVDNEGRPLADLRPPVPMKAQLVATVVEREVLF